MRFPAPPVIEALGDAALAVRWGDAIDADLNRSVHAAAARLRQGAPAWLLDVVPAYASLAVYFDGAAVSPTDVGAFVAARIGTGGETAQPASPGRPVVAIPVRYGGDDGPDLDDLAARCGQSPEAVIAAHAGGDYTVAMLGFSPGFPYLLGLDPALAAPRLATPRTLVPAGSVGIGGAQTGIYPDAGPGGWRLIGRTPLALFDPARDPPSLLQPGDRVRFESVAAWPDDRPPTRVAAAPAGPVIDVIAPGLQTTVQDRGRSGHRHLGVGIAGALDAYSARVANRLAGADDDAALLEIALVGPRLRFGAATRIAITGADIEARIGPHVVPGWRPVDVAAGSELVFGACRRGTRAYLAIAGGIGVPRVLGSTSTDLRGGFGGWHGRALRAGDALPFFDAASLAAGRRGDDAATPDAPRIARWWLDPTPDLDFDDARTIRVLPGRDATSPSDALCTTRWRVDARADRQGLRLDGAPLVPATHGERVSAPVAPGTVQLPPDGRPIVLLGEAQTIGGYPVIAHVIAADLPRLVQRRAGERVRFEPVDAGTATRIACGQRARLARMTLALERRARDA